MYSFLTTAPESVRVQRHVPAVLYLQERPGTHFTGGWVGPRAGLTGAGHLVFTGIRSPDRPARSESLYRLQYSAKRFDLGPNRNEYQSSFRV